MIQNLAVCVHNLQSADLGCQPELCLELCFFWCKRNLRQLHRLNLRQCVTGSLAKLPQTVIVRMLRDAACVRRPQKSPRPAKLSSGSAKIEQWDRLD